MKGKIKRSSKPQQLGKKAPRKKAPRKKKNSGVEQKLKNEQYRASRDYDFAEPGSGKEKMAKIRFKGATRLLKAHRDKK